MPKISVDTPFSISSFHPTTVLPSPSIHQALLLGRHSRMNTRRTPLLPGSLSLTSSIPPIMILQNLSPFLSSPFNLLPDNSILSVMLWGRMKLRMLFSFISILCLSLFNYLSLLGRRKLQSWKLSQLLSSLRQIRLLFSPLHSRR